MKAVSPRSTNRLSKKCKLYCRPTGSIPFTRSKVLLAPLRLDPDGRAFKTEPLPQLIDQKSLGGKVQVFGLIGKHDKGRGPHRALGHVVNLDIAIERQHFNEAV